jgi:transcriptional regulator with XRE-family HTH domain
MEDTEETIAARSDSLVDDHEKLLRSLVEHRRSHHISQETVAERMGVSQPTVAAFERYDANPTLSTIRRYALAVGVRLRTEISDDCVQHRRRAFAEGWPLPLEYVARYSAAPALVPSSTKRTRRNQPPRNLDVLSSIGAYTVSRTFR